MDEHIGLTQVIEELVAHPLAVMRSGNEPGDIDELDGNEARLTDAIAVARRRFSSEIRTGITRTHMTDAGIRLDRRERIIRDEHVSHRRRLEERRLAAIGLAHDSDDHGMPSGRLGL